MKLVSEVKNMWVAFPKKIKALCVKNPSDKSGVTTLEMVVLAAVVIAAVGALGTILVARYPEVANTLIDKVVELIGG